MLHNPLIVYVDVDDTFVRSIGAKRIPVTGVIEHIKALHAQGARLFCWSTGGADYAKQSALEFGLGDCFEAFLPKPQVMIDDQNLNEWRKCLAIHPLNCGNQSVETYKQQLD